MVCKTDDDLNRFIAEKSANGKLKCDESDGEGLTVSGNVSTLHAFKDITAIDCNFLKISGSQVRNFEGMEKIASAKSIWIKGNEVLESIAGFSSLTQMSGMLIDDNKVLESITGFNSLTEMSLVLRFKGNARLTHISGFDSVTKLQSISITKNAKLTHTPDFDNLQKLSSLNIDNNPKLSSLSSFNNLVGMGDKSKPHEQQGCLHDL